MEWHEYTQMMISRVMETMERDIYGERDEERADPVEDDPRPLMDPQAEELLSEAGTQLLRWLNGGDLDREAVYGLVDRIMTALDTTIWHMQRKMSHEQG